MDAIRPLTVTLTKYFLTKPAEQRAAFIAMHPEFADEIRRVTEAIERGDT